MHSVHWQVLLRNFFMSYFVDWCISVQRYSLHRSRTIQRPWCFCYSYLTSLLVLCSPFQHLRNSHGFCGSAGLGDWCCFSVHEESHWFYCLSCSCAVKTWGQLQLWRTKILFWVMARSSICRRRQRSSSSSVLPGLGTAASQLRFYLFVHSSSLHRLYLVWQLQCW